MPSPLLKAYNETPVKDPDLKKLSWNELEDRFTTINTKMDEIENKYEEGSSSWSEEDSKSYRSLLTEAEQVTNERSERPEALREQRQVLNVGPNASRLSTALNGLSQRIEMGRDLSEDDPRKGYRTDNEFLLDTVNALTNKVVSDKLKKVIINAVGDDEYSKGSWASAGILIPEGFLSGIMRITPEEDRLLGSMTSIPMGNSVVKVNAAVDKNHSTSFTGGTVVYRTAETRTAPYTKDSFERISMEATELVGATAVTRQLLRESPVSIPGLINASMKAAMSYKRRDEIINADGQGKPLGFLNPANTALLSVTRTPGQADATILSGTDILRMRQRVFGYDQAVWVFNYDAFEHVAQLHIESPNAAGLIKLYAPENGDVPATILGRPVVFTEFFPGIQSGQDGSVCTEWGETATGLHYAACVNMSQYLHGQLYEDQARSIHVRFDEREEVFQFVSADDARPWWLTYLTPKKGITTRSPFVALINTSTAA